MRIASGQHVRDGPLMVLVVQEDVKRVDAAIFEMCDVHPVDDGRRACRTGPPVQSPHVVIPGRGPPPRIRIRRERRPEPLQLRCCAQEAISPARDLRRLLRIVAPLSFGLTHLAPVFAELARRHPLLHVRAAYSDRFARRLCRLPMGFDRRGAED